MDPIWAIPSRPPELPPVGRAAASGRVSRDGGRPGGRQDRDRRRGQDDSERGEDETETGAGEPADDGQAPHLLDIVADAPPDSQDRGDAGPGGHIDVTA